MECIFKRRLFSSLGQNTKGDLFYFVIGSTTKNDFRRSCTGDREKISDYQQDRKQDHELRLWYKKIRLGGNDEKTS